MILVNGIAEDRIVISDRGLQYGDGVFETIAYRNSKTEYLQLHLDRLKKGCKTLGIPFSQFDKLQLELTQVITELANQDAVIKIIITRGSGGRGYLAPTDVEPTRIISTHPYPSYPESNYSSGVVVRYCQHKLSSNSSLAGLKHLNRLDQVIARSEWNSAEVAEGLMLDDVNHVIEGTMSNLFLVVGKQLITPLLNQCGISGIIRHKVIEFSKQLALDVSEAALTQQDIANADEVFVCNSVIGIWPVKQIEQQRYKTGPVTNQLQLMLNEDNKS